MYLEKYTLHIYVHTCAHTQVRTYVTTVKEAINVRERERDYMRRFGRR